MIWHQMSTECNFGHITPDEQLRDMIVHCITDPKGREWPLCEVILL